MIENTQALFLPVLAMYKLKQIEVLQGIVHKGFVHNLKVSFLIGFCQRREHSEESRIYPDKLEVRISVPVSRYHNFLRTVYQTYLLMLL